MKSYGSNPMSDPRSYLTVEQIESILSNCNSDKDLMLFTFLAKTGRRISEVVRCLKPKDIDFDKGLVNFTILKRKHEYKSLLPVNSIVLESLKKFIRRNNINDDNYIFPISRRRADQLFKKACKRAGITSVGGGKYNKPHIHLLRHSFAISAAHKLKNPADLSQLQELMGHGRIDTTMFYLKFAPNEKRELVEEL